MNLKFLATLAGTSLALSNSSSGISQVLDSIKYDVDIIVQASDSLGFSNDPTPGESVSELLGGDKLNELFGICNFRQCYRQQLSEFSYCTHNVAHLEECQCQFSENLNTKCYGDCYKSTRQLVKSLFADIGDALCPDRESDCNSSE